MTADQMRCRDAFEKWADREEFSIRRDATIGQYSDFATESRWATWQAAWNTRPTAVASHAEDAVAEVCYDSYGFGRLVWLKQFGKGNQPPHGSLLYTNPPRSGDEAERTVKENLTVGDEVRDAARYRWLRDHSYPGACAFYLSVGMALHGVRFEPQTVDNFIDAAMYMRGGK